eukprot:560965-Pyramimonas_sp.AAC.1
MPPPAIGQLLSGTVLAQGPFGAMGKKKGSDSYKPATQRLPQFKRTLVSTNTLLCGRLGMAPEE